VANRHSDPISSSIEAMQRLLFKGGPADEDIALPQHLDRSKLDRYLNEIHDNEQSVGGLSLLTTIWATALYIGEIIRRAAPARQYQWVTIGEDLTATGTTSLQHADIGAVRALRARDGELTMPSRAVLRVILRGQKARSVDSYARQAIGAPESKFGT
jgi:hypothetical protein